MPPARPHRFSWLAPFLLIALPAAAQDTKPAETPTRAQDPAAKAQDPAARAENPATRPATRPGAWMQYHQAMVEHASKAETDLLFLGDSITAGWKGAPEIWSRYYGPRKALNFGIGGDRTQHVLWRIENGEVDAIKPRVVVLMIGTNNLGHDTEDQVVEGVAAVVARLRAKLPDSKILLLGIFPRGLNRDKSQEATAPFAGVAKVNAGIARLDDGRMVKYLDIGDRLLDANGQVPKAVEPDFLHLSRKGYQIWADAMEPTLWELMERK